MLLNNVAATLQQRCKHDAFNTMVETLINNVAKTLLQRCNNVVKEFPCLALP